MRIRRYRLRLMTIYLFDLCWAEGVRSVICSGFDPAKDYEMGTGPEAQDLVVVAGKSILC